MISGNKLGWFGCWLLLAAMLFTHIFILSVISAFCGMVAILAMILMLCAAIKGSKWWLAAGFGAFFIYALFGILVEHQH